MNCVPAVHICIEICCHIEAKMMIYKIDTSHKHLFAGPENSIYPRNGEHAHPSGLLPKLIRVRLRLEHKHF